MMENYEKTTTSTEAAPLAATEADAPAATSTIATSELAGKANGEIKTKTLAAREEQEIGANLEQDIKNTNKLGARAPTNSEGEDEDSSSDCSSTVGPDRKLCWLQREFYTGRVPRQVIASIMPHFATGLAPDTDDSVLRDYLAHLLNEPKRRNKLSNVNLEQDIKNTNKCGARALTNSESEDEDSSSDCSSTVGPGWKLCWLQREFYTGRVPRQVIASIMPHFATGLAPDTDDSVLWDYLAHLLNEPKRRNKLSNVNTFDDVIDLVKKSQKIIVLTGAGVSVSCGIPDFRSTNGIYARLAQDFPDLPDPQAMLDINYFKRDPRPFYKFAREIYPGEFQPSPCHRFIKMLETKGKLLRNYTQNIDTLERVAGIQRVIECHGSFSTASCTKCRFKCNADALRADIFAQRIPVCPQCQPNKEQSVDASVAVTEEELRQLVENGIMKPDIVFFGEGLPDKYHTVIGTDMDICDLLIVIGSSLKVQPVAKIPSSIPATVPQILINREQLHHLKFDVELLGDSDVIINQICHRLSGNETGTLTNPARTEGPKPMTEVTAPKVNPTAITATGGMTELTGARVNSTPAKQQPTGLNRPLVRGQAVTETSTPVTSSEQQGATTSAAAAQSGAGVKGSAVSKAKLDRYEEMKYAAAILKRQAKSNITTPSAEWLKKLEWAKSVVRNFVLERRKEDSINPKRQRSHESTAQNAPKKIRTHMPVAANKSFAEMAKDKILLVVLDKGDTKGRIPRNQWKWVEAALAVQCFKVLEADPGPPPICKDAGWYQGKVKVMVCEGSRSAELLKAAVSRLGEVYPGAKLVAVDWTDILSRPTAVIWIPSSFKEPEKILSMLQRCNPSLPSSDWKVAKVEETQGPVRQVWLILNKDSTAPIEAKHGVLNFGFSSVRIQVGGNDFMMHDVSSGRADQPPPQ